MKNPFNGPRPGPGATSRRSRIKSDRSTVDQLYSQLSRGFAFFKMELDQKLAANGLHEFYVKRDGITTRYESLAEVSKALDMRWQEWGQK